MQTVGLQDVDYGRIGSDSQHAVATASAHVARPRCVRQHSALLVYSVAASTLGQSLSRERVRPCFHVSAGSSRHLLRTVCTRSGAFSSRWGRSAVTQNAVCDTGPIALGAHRELLAMNINCVGPGHGPHARRRPCIRVTRKRRLEIWRASPSKGDRFENGARRTGSCERRASLATEGTRRGRTAPRQQLSSQTIGVHRTWHVWR